MEMQSEGGRIIVLKGSRQPDHLEAVPTLKLEIQRKTVPVQEQETKRRKERAEQLRKGLTREVVDILVPQHHHTSCADDEIINVSRGCTRCALLEAVKSNFWDSDLDLLVEVVPMESP